MLKKYDIGKAKFNSKDIENLDSNYKSCIICFLDFKEGESIRILLCLHRYHDDCI